MSVENFKAIHPTVVECHNKQYDNLLVKLEEKVKRITKSGGVQPFRTMNVCTEIPDNTSHN